MRIYHRIGPNTGIGFGLGGGLLFAFLVLLGAIPFAAIMFVFYLGVFLVAMVLAAILACIGIFYKWATGEDALIPVPGSQHGTALEYWMEGKGWIRLPPRLSSPTNNTFRRDARR